MYITIESDNRETKLEKFANLHFVPHYGMGFWYGVLKPKVESVDYVESEDEFLLRFEDIKVNDSKFDITIIDLTDKGWNIKDQWKKK
jgi:hypothetical protein